MFTGIIEEAGTVREADRGHLVIACQKVFQGTNLGDSIAVNGVEVDRISHHDPLQDCILRALGVAAPSPQVTVPARNAKKHRKSN